MSTVAQLIDQAARLARDGGLQEAEGLYRRVLEIDPGNIAAMHALGRLCFRDGRTVEAVACYRRCLDCDGATAACLFDLGAALATLGKMADAEVAFAESLAAEWPDLPILFMSGHAESMVHNHSPLPQDVHLLNKPFRRLELAQMVRASLDR